MTLTIPRVEIAKNCEILNKAEIYSWLRENGYQDCDVNFDRILNGEEPFDDDELSDLDAECRYWNEERKMLGDFDE